MTALRWGILAAGGIARAFTSDLQTAGRAVTAVGSRTLASAEEFAREFDIPRAHGSYESLVSDPDVDVIYVATPHPFHAENALLALNGGKHVLVEKPFTLNAAEAERVRDRAAELGLVVLEAMWTRYLPHIRRVHEIISAGTLGDIRAVSADHTQRLSTDPSHRMNDLALGGGALLDLGIYPISFVSDILGSPTGISAQARFAETGVDTEIATVFTHAAGALSTTLSSSRAAGPDAASILGTEARIDIDRVWYSPTSFRVTSHDGTVLESYESNVDGRGMQFQALYLEELVASGRLSGDIQPIDETVDIMRTLDEIRSQIGLRYPSES
jgi:predicted dehydrogenase